ncbi:MAG: acylphosphatase [Roseobacter sp.]
MILLSGSLASDTALPWIEHRARLLDLRGWVRRDSAHQITIALSGPLALIDAMEVACSLGPGDVLVDAVSRETCKINRDHKGFHVLSSQDA